MPMNYRVGWRRPNATKHVFIAIPTYGDIKAGCVSSLNAVQHNLVAAGISGDVAILSGDCHVDDARNSLARSFLETDATHLMFIDADLEFSPDSVAKLLSYDEDVIGGVYPYKNDYEAFPYTVENPAKPKFDSRGLVTATGIPGGFTLIARRVVERLYKKAASKGAWHAKGDQPGRKPVVEIWHRTMERGKERRSGDYEFCRKVRDAGFSIWIAPFLRFAHIGDKRWEGSLQDFWLRTSGEYERLAVEAVEEIRKGGAGIEAFRTLSKAFGNEPFSADHVLLSVLYDLTKQPGINHVLETGSGLSSVVFAAAGAVAMSLEAEPSWGAKTDRLLAACKMLVTVEHAPIIHHECGRWYDVAGVRNMPMPGFDLVFIDGPRRDEDGIRARICDVMPEALKGAKVVVVDDTDDPDGMALLARLNKEFGFVFDVHNGPRRQFAVGTRE